MKCRDFLPFVVCRLETVYLSFWQEIPYLESKEEEANLFSEKCISSLGDLTQTKLMFFVVFLKMLTLSF